jgi:hypothetical protein
LVFAVPGFLFRWIYLSQEFNRQLLPKSWTDEIGKGILIAIPFHVVWVLVLDELKHNGYLACTVNYLTAFTLLTGNYGSPSTLVSVLYANRWYIITYYLIVVTTACVIAYVLRKIVWNLELDAKWNLLKYRNEWLYRIMGRGQLDKVKQDQTVALIDVLTDQKSALPCKAVLYQGRSLAFRTKEDGTLKNIMLADVLRAGFKTEGGQQVMIGKAVPGDEFVIDCSRVRNLNITYLTLPAYLEAVAPLSTDAHGQETATSSPPSLPMTLSCSCVSFCPLIFSIKAVYIPIAIPSCVINCMP